MWDLSCCQGIEIVVGGDVARQLLSPGVSNTANGWAASMVFTLVLKDALPPLYTDGGGREQSTVSYEATFSPVVGERVYLPFSGFKATYRGRPRKDTPPVNLANIRRFSVMVRRCGLFVYPLAAVWANVREIVSSGTSLARSSLRWSLYRL